MFKISIDNTIGDIFQSYLSFLLPYMTNSTVIRAEKSFGLVEPSGEWWGSLYRPPCWILPTQYYYKKRIKNIKYLTTKWLIILLIYHYFRYSVHYTFLPTKFVWFHLFLFLLLNQNTLKRHGLCPFQKIQHDSWKSIEQ